LPFARGAGYITISPFFLVFEGEAFVLQNQEAVPDYTTNVCGLTAAACWCTPAGAARITASTAKRSVPTRKVIVIAGGRDR
jgi:hypothetical protein